MVNELVCRECKAAMPTGAKVCECGWNRSTEKLPVKIDHRCAYAFENRRCPLPGAMCSYPYANGPWFCSEHWRTRDDPPLAEAVLRRAEAHFESSQQKQREQIEMLQAEKRIQSALQHWAEISERLRAFLLTQTQPKNNPLTLSQEKADGFTHPF